MDEKASSEANFRQSKPLHDWLKAAFLRLIVEETGLEIKKHDQATLDTQIFARMKALKISFAEDYYQLLASKTLESSQEWQNLIRLLTNPESFFFRDQGHFQLLEKHIIPDLVQRKRITRSIRVCSAGCSTGEEPYSLAILFKELIPDLEQWDLCILGLDINSLSLEKAKTGIYRPWSFRTVAPKVRERYFKVINHEYHIAPDIKQMLKFQTLNLVKDAFPDSQSEMREMDLIICRNVFIYFEETAISTVLEKFYNTLQPSGYLLTGHTELYMQNLSRFQAQIFPEAMIYRRLDDQHLAASSADTQDYSLRIEDIDERLESQVQQTSKIETIAQAADNLSSKLRYIPNAAHTEFVNVHDAPLDEKELLHNAKNLMRQKAYNLAIAQVEKALELNSQSFYSHYLMAHLLKCLDHDEKANLFCQTALEIDPSSILPYYVLADIAGKHKRWSEMKQILKKIIYLEPGAIAAYLKLSYLYQAENDLERMYKMQSVALKILQQLPPDMEILELDYLTVAQLILQL